MDVVVAIIAVIAVVGAFGFISWKLFADSKRRFNSYSRSLRMATLLIHLPPRTDDIQGGGRDNRDVTNEALQQAQVMYSIISSTLTRGFKAKLYGQRHISIELVAHDGLIHYYAIVPRSLVDTVTQAITAAYPTARLESVDDPNFFSEEGGFEGISGGEMELREDYWYPIATYEDTKRDASLGLINALSVAKKGDGIGVQIMFRPCAQNWVNRSLKRVQDLRDGKKERSHGGGFLGWLVGDMGQFFVDMLEALWRPPDPHDPYKQEEKVLTNLEQEEVQRVEEKTKYPGFQVLVRVIASSSTEARAAMLSGGVVSVFSQFDLQNYNGFRFNMINDSKELVTNYLLRSFPADQNKCILNSVEMASIFHLPSQQAIPTSQVERQATKQVDGPGRLAEEGVILGVNEFRGEKKIIRLGVKDRRRHTYVIGATGMGKSVLLTNIAYQDMCNGDGFAFIDPHGDAAEMLLSKVPPERMDDVIYFEPGNMDNPVGMNMFEFQDESQKDFIVQESLNMMISLYDPGNQGIFGPRAQHMFRNAALLLMSDPAGGTFIDVPRCFTDPDFVRSKLKYVTDKTVYDYWTKEFPASQRSNDAGEVTSWFVSKWGPFLSNKMMRNILGQTKSGFNIRKIMDEGKILLVNLSKGKTGELNAKLLGMIFVMKFQAAAMSRQDIRNEDDRRDFCLFVDEFQNFSTDSFESILSEARKYHLNLVLANQFMTQLTDKIREAVLGNVGTIMSGRLGVTDAELMQKAFAPIFNAEDLHAMPNYTAVATVMMFGMPTSPFTMSLLPSMGEGSPELMDRMKEYASSKYGRPRADVEREIEARLADAPKRPAKKAPDAESSAGAAAATPVSSARAKRAARINASLAKSAEFMKRAKEKAKMTPVVTAQSQAATAPVAPVTKTSLPSRENILSTLHFSKQASKIKQAEAMQAERYLAEQERQQQEAAMRSAWSEKAAEAKATEPSAPSEPSDSIRISHDEADREKLREERAERRAEAMRAKAQIDATLSAEDEAQSEATEAEVESAAAADSASSKLSGGATITQQADGGAVLRWR